MGVDLKMVMQVVPAVVVPINPAQLIRVMAVRVLPDKVLVEEIHVVEVVVKFLVAEAVELEAQDQMVLLLIAEAAITDLIHREMEGTVCKILSQVQLFGILVAVAVAV